MEIEMVIAHCLTCEFHEKVEIDGELSSRCCKENCISVYSNCIRVVAIKKFIAENDMDHLRDQSSALEICYPVA